MSDKHFIPIATLSKHYKVKTAFLTSLDDHGLIEITTVKAIHCLHEDHIVQLEKMIRLHHDLHLNTEGIGTVLNLLERIDDLQLQLRSTKRRLEIYEG